MFTSCYLSESPLDDHQPRAAVCALFDCSAAASATSAGVGLALAGRTYESTVSAAYASSGAGLVAYTRCSVVPAAAASSAATAVVEGEVVAVAKRYRYAGGAVLPLASFAPAPPEAPVVRTLLPNAELAFAVLVEEQAAAMVTA